MPSATSSRKARRIGPMRFSAVIFPNAANTVALVGNRQLAPDACGRVRVPAGEARTPIRSVSTTAAGYSITQVGRDARVVDGDRPGRHHDHAQHRPERVDRPAQPFDRVLREMAHRVGMIELELGAVVVGAVAAQQRACAGVVEPRVVQHDQAGDRRRDTPTCSRGRARCPVDRPSDRRARGDGARRSRGRRTRARPARRASTKQSIAIASRSAARTSAL